jgi:hypothetical protein
MLSCRIADVNMLPTLKEIFRSSDEPKLATAGTLAGSLSLTIEQLEPFVDAGYIKARSSPPLTTQSWIEIPPEAALTWMRSWFQPPQAKPLLSAADMSALLEIEQGEVVKLAARHSIPVTRDPILGWLFSVWGAQKLITCMLRGRPSNYSPRFDRQAMLWWLLQDDPERVATVPSYNEELEQEIQRVSRLKEPTKTLRAQAIIAQFREAREIAEAAGVDTAAVADKFDGVVKKL